MSARNPEDTVNAAVVDPEVEAQFWGSEIQASEAEERAILPQPGRLSKPGVFADFRDRQELRRSFNRQQAAKRLSALIAQSDREY